MRIWWTAILPTAVSLIVEAWLRAMLVVHLATICLIIVTGAWAVLPVIMTGACFYAMAVVLAKVAVDAALDDAARRWRDGKGS